ncbi:thymidine phosphorylase [Marinicella sp. W31]|uniref:thymidine phosphorylase n=1 Tax=Marinicella sp. W31 TaxID=3023713 RepID=UPI0037574865
MLTEEIIALKKRGAELSSDQIKQFVSGIGDQTVSAEQIAALAMAIHFQGMTTRETTDLTLAMRDSGDYLLRNDLHTEQPVVDKHSTGGVGDCVSLILAPLLACYGYSVPMIAGRGLGHTGGTIDKLESIPGYTAEVSCEKLAEVVNAHGCAIVGQSARLTPADKRFYAVRDTTATIDILPLIVASILSKKLSEGIDGLIMDIKVGNGAFMQTQDEADRLATMIKNTAEQAGVRTAIQFNDMSQPLCPVAGNALEVAYVIDHLTGSIQQSRLLDNSMDLAVELIRLFEPQRTVDTITEQLTQLIRSGQVYEKFCAFLYDLGCTKINQFNALSFDSKIKYEIKSPVNGVVKAIDTRAIGNFLIKLRAGRQISTDQIDYHAGISHMPELGAALQIGDVIGVLHAESSDDLKILQQEYLQYFTLE